MSALLKGQSDFYLFGKGGNVSKFTGKMIHGYRKVQSASKYPAPLPPLPLENTNVSRLFVISVLSSISLNVGAVESETLTITE